MVYQLFLCYMYGTRVQVKFAGSRGPEPRPTVNLPVDA